MVLPPHNRPRSPRMDEDKDSTLGNSYYDDSPLGSPNRDSFSEPAGEGSFRPDIGLTDKDLIDIGMKRRSMYTRSFPYKSHSHFD